MSGKWDASGIERKESADKPGSVEDSHSSGTHVTARLKRPTREHARAARRSRSCLFPYLVLLRVGFTLPLMLPPARCALTAPFHPYLPRVSAGSAVSFLWHFPWTRAPQALPGTLPYGARTFLPSRKRKERLSGQLPAAAVYPRAQRLSRSNGARVGPAADPEAEIETQLVERVLLGAGQASRQGRRPGSTAGIRPGCA